jgi:uncharacterized membrane protein YgaE (UPF0421/DUF939 family)
MELVTVEKTQLLEYIAYTDRMLEKLKKETQKNKDAKQLADIVEETYQARLDLLADEILNSIQDDKHYKGLMRAYQIMQGRD